MLQQLVYVFVYTEICIHTNMKKCLHALSFHIYSSAVNIILIIKVKLSYIFKVEGCGAAANVYMHVCRVMSGHI